MSMRIRRSFFTIGLLGGVFLVVAALLAPISRVHAAYASGSLITCGDARAVYYVGTDGKRYVFPTRDTYASWFPQDTNFSQVRNASIADCNAMPFGGNVTMRPGVHLVKLPYDAAVYVIGHPQVLRHVGDASILRSWFPSVDAAFPDSGWERQLRVVPEQFWNDYAIGTGISSVNDYSFGAAKNASASIAAMLGLAEAPALTPEPQPTPEPEPAPQPAPSNGLEIGGRNPVPTAPEGGGNFRTFCHVSHFNNDDPIVFPNQPGRSHLHMYFGNTGVNAETTANSILTTGEGSCNGGILNRTGYWVPAMLNGSGEVMRPLPVNVYYKNGSLPPETIQPMPNGLRMIAGDARATPSRPQEKSVAEFSCLSTHTTQVTHIPNCAPGDTLIVQLRFPQCWDGVNLDSADHKSHLAYAQWVGGDSYDCPSTHPVRLPQLAYVFDFPVDDPNGTANWRLSSDGYDVTRAAGRPGGHSIHGDWMMAWDRTTVETWTRECVNARKDCANGEMGDGTRLRDAIQRPLIVPGAVEQPSHDQGDSTDSSPEPTPTPEPAPSPEPEPQPEPEPTSSGSISVRADGPYVTWSMTGTVGAQGGTMMVFGRSQNPAHHEGEATAYYRPYTGPTADAWVNDVYGPGTYYVRICSYNESNDTCNQYSEQVTVTF